MRFFTFMEAGNPAQIVADGQIPFKMTPSKTVERIDTLKVVSHILPRYFQRVDKGGWRSAKERFRFEVAKADYAYGEMLIMINIVPIHKGGTEELSTPDNPMDDYYQKHQGGKTGRTVYKTPKAAIEDITADPAMGYRGMAGEEWQAARRAGFLGSRGRYNLGDEQAGYTFFGYEPRTALNYAHGFAPVQFTTSFRKPSVVIAVPRTMLLSHRDDPRGIPKSELAFKGRIPLSSIAHAWMLTPAAGQNGYIEFVIPYTPDDSGFYTLNLDKAREGSGHLVGVSSYSILPLF